MSFKVVSPKTVDKLLQAIAENQGRNFRFCAGGTDLLLEIKKNPVKGLTVINLAQLDGEDFTSIDISADRIRIGALVTAHRIAGDDGLRQQIPALCEAAIRHGSRQIRQVATVGGNLCTASPAGDMACALVALEAKCEILSARGTVRTIPIDQFFIDVRKTDLKRDEVLRGVTIPIDHAPKAYSGFVKVGTRRSMECAVVSLAYHFRMDDNDRVLHAGVAIGSVAPTIKFVTSARDYLIGKTLSPVNKTIEQSSSQTIGAIECEAFARTVLEYASPISDIRGSAWYRSEVLFNISKSILQSARSISI